MSTGSTAHATSEPTGSIPSVDSTVLRSWVDSSTDWVSEWLNPILVKEARQALKSRQFVATFTLLLLAALVWSLIGVSMLTPGIYYAPSGTFMLVGYFVILAVPLLLVVPFSAFWSLARERDDQTFELLSITTLSARQIITGKLGSSILQMLVYYSALAPCITFTYLLRGIDILSIGLLLSGTFVVSVLFSLIGLALAALANQRHWQMLVAVLLLIFLITFGFYWIAMMSTFLFISSQQVDSQDFWFIVAALITGAATYVVLLTRVAAAQISFSSDNRATPVRRAMLGQLVLFAGWMGFFFFHFSDDAVLAVAIAIAGIHWFAYGTLMNGETADISPRAKRKLPQSLLGRSFFTWFNPGAETGYIFSVATWTAFTMLILSWAWWSEISNNTTVDDGLILFVLLVWAYIVFYLGLGRSLVGMVSMTGLNTSGGFFLSLMIHLVMILFACLVPTFIESWLQGFVDLDYTAVQSPNWFWTLIEAADGDLDLYLEVPVIVVSAALAMLFIHLVLATREVRHVRTLVPSRVLEDERTGNKAQAPVATSPF